MNANYVALGQICDVQKGTSITKKKLTSGSIPVIAGGQKPAYFHGVSNRPPGTITVSASGAYAGYVSYYTMPIFASDCITVRSKDETVFLTKYIYLMLKVQQKKVYALQQGAGQPHVYGKDLALISIPSNPIDVQHQIIALIERVECLRDKRRIANNLTNELTQSLFDATFGIQARAEHKWQMGKIRDLIIGTQYGTSAKSHEEPRGTPTLRMNNVTATGGWDFDSLKYTDLEPDEDKYLVRTGQLLFNRTNSRELVGKCAVYREIEPMGYAGYLIKVETEHSATAEYIAGYLNSPHGKKVLFSMAKTIVGMANINAQELQNISIPLVPLDVQRDFEKRVHIILAIKKKQENGTEQIQRLFDSLLSRIYNGELPVSA